MDYAKRLLTKTVYMGCRRCSAGYFISKTLLAAKRRLPITCDHCGHAMVPANEPLRAA